MVKKWLKKIRHCGRVDVVVVLCCLFSFPLVTVRVRVRSIYCTGNSVDKFVSVCRVVRGTRRRRRRRQIFSFVVFPFLQRTTWKSLRTSLQRSIELFSAVCTFLSFFSSSRRSSVDPASTKAKLNDVVGVVCVCVFVQVFCRLSLLCYVTQSRVEQSRVSRRRRRECVCTQLTQSNRWRLPCFCSLHHHFDNKIKTRHTKSETVE